MTYNTNYSCHYYLLQMDLTDWKDVLNRIDDHIESILYLRRHQIILVQRDVVSIVTEEDTVGLERDIRYLTDYLNFTSSLLKNSVHKDTYNSTEVSEEHCYSHDLCTTT